MPPSRPKTDELLTPEQVAERLHIHKRTVLKLAREGKLRRVKVSHKVVLFEEEAIADFVRRRRQNGHTGRQRPLFDPAGEQLPARF